jgi:hypothetical protein
MHCNASGPQRKEILGLFCMFQRPSCAPVIFSVAEPMNARFSTDFKSASNSVIRPSRANM